jgi:hypothetical protein
MVSRVSTLRLRSVQATSTPLSASYFDSAQCKLLRLRSVQATSAALSAATSAPLSAGCSTLNGRPFDPSTSHKILQG